MTLAIDIPESIVQRLRAQWGDVPRKALEAVAVQAYRSGALTAAEVGVLLGSSSRWETEEFLKSSGAYLDYSEDDLAHDLDELRLLRPS